MSGIPSWAVPGARVVCVASDLDDVWFNLQTRARATGPTFGQICTVIRTYVDQGIGYIVLDGWGEYGWQVTAFRPAVDDDTEAAMFRARRTSRAQRRPASSKTEVDA